MVKHLLFRPLPLALTHHTRADGNSNQPTGRSGVGSPVRAVQDGSSATFARRIIKPAQRSQ